MTWVSWDRRPRRLHTLALRRHFEIDEREETSYAGVGRHLLRWSTPLHPISITCPVN
jgi:hypothetical protein